MDTQRAIQEYLVFGLLVNGYLDGVPQFYPTLSAPQLTLKTLIDDAHISNLGECGVSGYLNKDLNDGNKFSSLYVAVTADQWEDYIKLQKKIIKGLRKEAWVDAIELFFDEYQDKADVASMNHVNIKALFSGVKDLYPYPTDYNGHP